MGPGFCVHGFAEAGPHIAFCGEYSINQTHEIMDARPIHVGFTIVHNREDRKASDAKLPVEVDEQTRNEFYRCGAQLLDLALAASKGR